MSEKFAFKLITLMVLLAIASLCFADANQKVIFSNSGNKAQLLNNNAEGFELQFRNQEYFLEEVETPSGKFTRINMDSFGFSQRIGEPQLPVYSKLIAVPVGAKVEFSFGRNTEITLSKSETNITNRIYPTQPSVSKSQDPALIPFELKTDIYSKNEFYSGELFSVEEIGFLRGVRIFRIDYEPMRYNPVSGELKINTELNVQVKFINADFSATQDLLARTASYEFDSLYGKILLNWQKNERLNVNRYPTKMVILCPPNYVSTMQTFVNWKTQQGYKVIVTTVGTGGTVANNTTAIKNYMQTLWNNATASDPAPTYLLIVGDTSTSGDNIIANTGATSSSHITDLNYVRLNGTDYLPELYYGRFSVASATELTNVINKTLQFEQTTMPDLSYLGKTVLIAGVDSNFGPTHGNGAINYGTTQYFNSAHNITSNTYLYPASGSSDAQIIANASEGRGYINYTAHGSETSWADPAFSISDINGLNNTNKYSVVVGNCCLTNAFNTGVCFGEAFLRANNKGAVSYIGGTNSTYWDEDYWWAVGSKGTANGSAPAYDASKLGAYDAMFHTHSEAFTNWATTVGETVMMGNSAVEQSASSRKNYYWEIYSIMGDPSLMPYYGVPTTNTATFPASIIIGATSITVTATPYSRVALSKDGVLYGSDIVPASGTLTLTINPITTAGTATLVITAQNKITRIENITVAAGDTPYISVDSCTYSDSNNNIPEYNETGYYSVTFKNLGQVASSSATATLTCSTTGITITDGTESLSAIAAGGTLTKNNAFRFNVANNITNQLQANFKITITSGTYTWEYNFTQTLYAPALSFGDIAISDPTGNNNGKLDPGETATLSIPLNNSGGANSPAGSATLTCTTTGITINNGSASFTAITAGSSATLSFTITAASSVSQGTLAALNFNATAGAYTAAKTQNLEIGAPTVVTIGTGTSTQSYPLDRYYNYSAFEAIYLASELQYIGTIKSLGFYKASGSDVNPIEAVTIYMKNTAESTLSDGDYSTTGYTQVYSGSFTNDATSGWMSVDLSPQFTCNGSNLAILIVKGYQAYTFNYPNWTYTTTTTTRVRCNHSDSAAPTSLTGSTSLPNLQIKIFPTPGILFPPQNLTAVPGNGSVTLSWQAPLSGQPTGYKIYKNSALLTTVTGLTYTDTAVVNGTTYSYYLKAVYATGESSSTATVTATPFNVFETGAIIGTGTASTGTKEASPINVYYQSLHGQSVYTKAELNNAGVFGPVYISQVGFNVTGVPDKTMPNFVVRMKHTTATDVSSWIDNTNLVTVYTNASYSISTTGYNMLTLSTPFLWNGTDNLLIDTAFGLIGSYSSTGTVQYTSVTNGYRYTRSDSADQTNVFSSGSTSVYKPNVKLFLTAVAGNPQISVNPTSFTFGSVAVGTTSTQNFTITNTGGSTLTGSITTPTGYSVTAAAKEIRNTLSFSIPAGQSKTYILSFSPVSAISYNGNVTISSNSQTQANLSLPVTGSGYFPPTISVNTNTLSANLTTGAESTQTFTISNTGSQSLTYTMVVSEPTGRNEAISPVKTTGSKSIAGSTLTLNADEYTSGTTVDWTFTVTNASTDTEWLKEIIVTFPAGVTVNSATNFVGGSGGDLVPDNTTGAGITISWFGESDYGYGLIHGSESATATVNVTISAGLVTTIVLPYTINGDIWGAEPNTVSGEISLACSLPPVEWFSVTPNSGNIPAGGNQTISGHFSAVGMAEGIYNAVLTIQSNDPVHPITTLPVTMDVSSGNHSPHINLPESFSFDKNGSLTVAFASYISDADNDPLTLSVSGNNHIHIAINGTQVTFTADLNWVGSENITFGVSDGELTAYDNVIVIVNPVNVPDWQPIVYPNNPATVYAQVSIEGIPAQLNDLVGAFVNNECRGTGEIVLIDRATAYSTILVNLASDGELVQFKIYSYANDAVYPVQETLTMQTGSVYGSAENPVVLNGTFNIVLTPPQVNLVSHQNTYRLTWNAVPNANNYRIYSCSEPYGTYQLVHTTANLYWEIPTTQQKCFFKVVAEQIGISKGK
ncbi:MAG: choice-of-anchor D domain-containing protein [Candidatus Cloacimonas sp.]|nr:choice-of-anchor D domain-containing protein [Candidatus Cloacimonas sp.]